MPPSDGSRIPDVRDGVLLYYKYVPIPEVPLIVKWYEDLCTSLGLVGRIRVSPEGVNVTVRARLFLSAKSALSHAKGQEAAFF